MFYVQESIHINSQWLTLNPNRTVLVSYDWKHYYSNAALLIICLHVRARATQLIIISSPGRDTLSKSGGDILLGNICILFLRPTL